MWCWAKVFILLLWYENRVCDFTAIKLYLWKQEVGLGAVYQSLQMVIQSWHSSVPRARHWTAHWNTCLPLHLWVYHMSIKVWGRAPQSLGSGSKDLKTIWWQPGKNYKIIFTAWRLLSLALGLWYAEGQQLQDDEPMRLTGDLRNSNTNPSVYKLSSVNIHVTATAPIRILYCTGITFPPKG